MPDPILNQPFEAPLARGGVLTQTWALLVDAYRELNAKKLFWITMILSVLVAGVFFLVSIDPTGITVAGFQLPVAGFNSNLIEPGQFFKLMFANYAVPIWLGFVATILALISVSSVFPDLLTGGSIDLYLSKPISRLRLFFTKYVFGLLFAALQVAAFTIVSYFVMGLRGGVWDGKIFLAIPIVTLFFSYLFCVCTLVGVVTRSTLAAILVTMLLWGVMFVINLADGGTMFYKHFTAMRIETQDKVIAQSQWFVDENNARPADERADYSKSWEFQLKTQQAARAELESSARNAARWHQGVFLAKSFLPKTSETVQLLDRTLIDNKTRQFVEDSSVADAERADARRAERRARNGNKNDDGDGFSFVQQHEIGRRTEAEVRDRSAWWVTGTSIGFEAFVLMLAAWVFCRRDY